MWLLSGEKEIQLLEEHITGINYATLTFDMLLYNVLYQYQKKTQRKIYS